MSFDLVFPTAILNDRIEGCESINDTLIKHIHGLQETIPSGGSNWLGRPYNTCGTYNIVEDSMFNVITEQVTKAVHSYASRLGINTNRNKFTATEGWLNIYSQQDFQEFHYHSGFVFSAVYYVQVPANSSEIIFESPLLPDMNPLPVMLHSNLTDERARYQVSAGQVIVFRSNLRHCVPAHTGTENRISLAFNFK
jgi:uncharacterized protein (TIGR02466 family)